jgi:flavin reductase (DIM6/NTAB) family NADH-FMN oxidoreductase RutF
MSLKKQVENRGNHRELRNALGCFCTGVAVVTTRINSGGHAGVTVNSFSSVSLDPPLVLFCLVRTANILESFRAESRFSVNFLCQHQQQLSNMFAKPSSAKWDSISFSLGDNGCALFSETLGHLECAKISELDGGDHVIFVGQVLRFHVSDSLQPLLFYRGSYGAFRPDGKGKIYQAPSYSQADISGWG